MLDEGRLAGVGFAELGRSDEIFAPQILDEWMVGIVAFWRSLERVAAQAAGGAKDFR